jgi:pimeloyl-ACP methyl ester carboxylesterase
LTREIVAFDIEDTTVVGTHHVPGPTIVPRSDVAALFLNAGAAPRAGNSDLSVHVADRLAQLGVHALRVDLPGLGDSFGESPTDLKTYWRGIVAGRSDGATAALIASVRQRLGVRALVIGGLCAGSVIAIRAAAAGIPGVGGLILFEPEFRISPGQFRGPARTKPGEKLAPSAPQDVAAPSRLKRRMIRILGMVGLKVFPADTNRPLLNDWLALLAKGTPSFVAVAEGLTAHAYIDAVQRKLAANGRRALACTLVPGTNHILTAGDARRVTIVGIEQWITSAFAQRAEGRAI